MSKKISSFFVANSIVIKEDIEFYEYSLEIFLSTILNFVAIVIMAVLTKSILITSVYLLGFIPLRLIAGGFHATTHLKCFLVLMGTYVTYLAIIKCIPHTWIFCSTIIANLVALVLIFILAPVEDENKPVSEEGKKFFKVKSRIAIISYFIVVLIMMYTISNMIFAFSLALGLLSIAFSLLASLVRNKIQKSH